ncbi:MAG: hypothetical protein ABIZ49_01600 [Opitutaceae bacterium]
MLKRSAQHIGPVKPVHPHRWLWEPLETDPTFVLRSMFGTKAAYLGGKLVLCFCARNEPWRGVLVCTDRTQHEALRREFPELSPHPILPKWLYLPESADAFERTATFLVAAARSRDPRVGIIPRAKIKKPLAKPGGKAVSKLRRKNRP